MAKKPFHYQPTKKTKLITDLKDGQKLVKILPIEIDWEFVGSGGQPDLKTQIFAEKRFRTFKKMFNDDLKNLIAKLGDLKDQESNGKNTKAFEEAKKQLSAWNNKTKEHLDDLKEAIRKELKKDKTIGKTSVVSRSKFREFKLARGAFEGGAASEKFVSLYKLTSTSLVKQSTEIVKQNTEERKLRNELIEAVELLNTEKNKFEIEKKLVRDAKVAIENYLPKIRKYRTNIDDMKTNIGKAKKPLTKESPLEKKETSKINTSLTTMTKCCDDVQTWLNKRLTWAEILDKNIKKPNPKAFKTALEEIKKVDENNEKTKELQTECKSLEKFAKRIG